MGPSANAIHESGHAVIALFSGLTIDHLSIEQAPSAFENCLRPVIDATANSDKPDLETLARILAGGDIAEQIHAGVRSPRQGAKADYERILTLAQEAGCDSPQEQDAYFTRISQTVLSELTAPGRWYCVQQLAMELDRERRLDADQIAEVVNDAKLRAFEHVDDIMRAGLVQARKVILTRESFSGWYGFEHLRRLING